jgi:hypothetical protein
MSESTPPLGLPAESGKREPSGPHEGVVLGLWAIVTFAIVAVLLVRTEHHDVNDPVKRAERGEITATSADSLVRPQRLRRALRVLAERAGPDGVVTSFRLAPDRLNTAVRAPDGKRTLVNINPAFGVTTSDYGFGSDEGFAASSVPADVPARMLREVAARAGVSPDALDYLVYNAGDSGWSLFLKPGGIPFADTQWVAAADGSELRRNGEQAPSKADETRDVATCLEEAENAADAANCVQ